MLYFSIDVHGFAVHTLIDYLNHLNNKILTKTRVNEDQTKDPTRSNIKKSVKNTQQWCSLHTTVSFSTSFNQICITRN